MSQHKHEPEPKGKTLVEVFSKEKPENKEVYPPDPPADPFPTEKAVVFGDASATYGSMVAPETIRPAQQLPIAGPQKKEKEATGEELKDELKHRKDHK